MGDIITNVSELYFSTDLHSTYTTSLKLKSLCQSVIFVVKPPRKWGICLVNFVIVDESVILINLSTTFNAKSFPLLTLQEECFIIWLSPHHYLTCSVIIHAILPSGDDTKTQSTHVFFTLHNGISGGRYSCIAMW